MTSYLKIQTCTIVRSKGCKVLEAQKNTVYHLFLHMCHCGFLFRHRVHQHGWLKVFCTDGLTTMEARQNHMRNHKIIESLHKQMFYSTALSHDHAMPPCVPTHRWRIRNPKILYTQVTGKTSAAAIQASASSSSSACVQGGIPGCG